MKIVLLNGPPRSGKDTVAKALVPHSYVHVSLARPLKEKAHALYGLDVPFDYFEDRKDEPAEEFGGAAPREVYIEVGEMMKRRLGKDIWARWLRATFQSLVDTPAFFRDDYVGFVVSDLGFPYEVEPLARGMDALIVRLHRGGCTFANDSREYVNHLRVPIMELGNHGTAEELQLSAIDAIGEWFKVTA